MPVDMEIVWVLEDCVACSEGVVPLVVLVVVSLVMVERSGRGPPSRFMASWILVSLVSRASVALRMRFSEDMVGWVAWVGIGVVFVYCAVLELLGCERCQRRDVGEVQSESVV